MNTVWHSLLIYYICEMQNIVRNLTDIDLFNYYDIEEALSWSTDDVKTVLSRLTPACNDSGNFPWCSRIETAFQICSRCKYGERHGKCISDGNISIRSNINESSLYFHILTELKKKFPSIKSLSQVVPISDLIGEVTTTYRTLVKMQGLKAFSLD